MVTEMFVVVRVRGSGREDGRAGCLGEEREAKQALNL